MLLRLLHFCLPETTANKVGAVTGAVGVDFSFGHGKWGDEDFIDPSVEASPALIVTNGERGERDGEETRDELGFNGGSVQVENDGVAVVGGAEVVPSGDWGVESVSDGLGSYGVPEVDQSLEGWGVARWDTGSVDDGVFAASGGLSVGEDTTFTAGTIAFEERAP